MKCHLLPSSADNRTLYPLCVGGYVWWLSLVRFVLGEVPRYIGDVVGRRSVQLESTARHGMIDDMMGYQISSLTAVHFKGDPLIEMLNVHALRPDVQLFQLLINELVRKESWGR
ncbi:hypothetical protein B0H11DRAFT_2005372 [Mycena galericulata]|nr:hypothetical protein B0H11DRAFT_2005372 [Mycena galericulata]